MQTLKILPKQSSFFVDDFIEGKIELSTSVQIIINDINVILNSNESWTTFSKELNSNICENKTTPIITQNLDVKAKLHINTNLVAIKAGKIVFDFKIKAPKPLEPSFEFPGKSDKAYLRYFLSSNIISPYTVGKANTFIILKKRQKIEMNKQVVMTWENNVHSWGLFSGGKMKFIVTSINGTDNFKFGEDIKFNIDIDNTNGKLLPKECKIVLKRNIRFNNSYGQLKKEMLDELNSKTIKTELTPGEHKSFPFVLSLKNIENKNFVIEGAGIPYTNFADINYFLPSIKTITLECSYSIKFTLYFKKFVKFNDRPRIIMNAIICHQSMDEYKAEMNQKLNMNRANSFSAMPNNMLHPPNLVPPHLMAPPNMTPPHMMPPPILRPPPNMVPPHLTNSQTMMPPPNMEPPRLMTSQTITPGILRNSQPMMPMNNTMTPPQLMQQMPLNKSLTLNKNEKINININAVQKVKQIFNDLYNILSGEEDSITAADVYVLYLELCKLFEDLNNVINKKDENISKINQFFLILRDVKKPIDVLTEDEKEQMKEGLNNANISITNQINSKTSNQNMIPPNQNMIPPNQNMIPPNQNMMSPNQNMAPQNQNMMLPNQNMITPNQNMIPPNQNSIQQNQNVIPPNQNITPQNQNMMPQNQNTMPPNQNMIPPNQNMIPPNQNMMPPKHNMIPQNQNMIPPNQNMMPPKHNMIPQNQNMIPPNQNMIPPNHNMIPPNQYMIPPNQNMAPQNQNMTPPMNEAPNFQKSISAPINNGIPPQQEQFNPMIYNNINNNIHEKELSSMEEIEKGNNMNGNNVNNGSLPPEN